MPQAITQFFSSLGLPVRGQRWSWGADNGTAILLRTWSDHTTKADGVYRVGVLGQPSEYRNYDSVGLDERFRHLEALWAGTRAGYTTIVRAADPSARPRKIASFREDAVFVIDRLELLADGSISAVLNGLVQTGELAKHAQTHRTHPGDGPFPADKSMRTGASDTEYQEKIPRMRKHFEDVCRAEGTLTYSEVMGTFGLTYFSLNAALGRLGRECKDDGRPIITSIVVDQKTGRCSVGFLKEFGIEDDAAERRKCYDYWKAQGQTYADQPDAAAALDEAAPEPEDGNEAETSPHDDLAERAARFAQVELRPHQAAFRLAVFNACNGRCVVSGCSVPEALEAAHLQGRAWREGQNSADDGILLRRDLHTLYDRDLLSIDSEGRVAVAESVRHYYGEWHGVLSARSL